jgi:hypothetical protein
VNPVLIETEDGREKGRRQLAAKDANAAKLIKDHGFHEAPLM